MKRETLFLRMAVFLIGIPVLLLCALGMRSVARELAQPDVNYVFISVFMGMFAIAVPFFIALYQALRLLGHIDSNKAFSDLSVRALMNIKRCAVAIVLVSGAYLPVLYYVAEKDDAPGILAIGLVISFAAMVIGVFAAVLQKLLRNAIDIKSENDLTV